MKKLSMGVGSVAFERRSNNVVFEVGEIRRRMESVVGQLRRK